MDDPVRHWFDTIMKFVPGFQGYERPSDRAKSATETRTWLTDQLQRAKRGLESHTRKLVDAGHLDELTHWDRLRHQLDHQIARIQGMTEQYRGFFRSGDLEPKTLEDLYDCEANLLDAAQAYSDQLEKLKPESAPQTWIDSLEEITRYLDRREDFLKGRESS